MNHSMHERFREIWSDFDPDVNFVPLIFQATSFIKVGSLSSFLIALGAPLGWDTTFENNYNKQQEYLEGMILPKYN